MAVNEMGDILPFEATDTVLPTHSEPVNIFTNTRAIEVPGKLNSLAASFKQFNVSVRDAWYGYINVEFGKIATHMNDSIDSMVAFINDSIVSTQNLFIENAETAVENIGTASDDQVTAIEEATAIFKQEIIDEVGGYAGTTGYSKEVSNSFEFSGETSGDTYDEYGRLLSFTQGQIETTNIVYGDNYSIVSFTETITIGVTTSSKNYVVIYEVGKIPKTQEVVI